MIILAGWLGSQSEVDPTSAYQEGKHCYSIPDEQCRKQQKLFRCSHFVGSLRKDSNGLQVAHDQVETVPDFLCYEHRQHVDAD